MNWYFTFTLSKKSMNAAFDRKGLWFKQRRWRTLRIKNLVLPGRVWISYTLSFPQSPRLLPSGTGLSGNPEAVDLKEYWIPDKKLRE
ncbi:MAG: hypothetical protein HZB30_13295 [Nitrospirae bacterium]|nr:hypothetical protein [Nitrospirota bacterium]